MGYALPWTYRPSGYPMPPPAYPPAYHSKGGDLPIDK